MPIMQVTIHELNDRFHPERVGQQDAATFGEELSLRDVITDKLAIGQGIDGFGDFLDTAPDAIVSAMLATFRSAVRRNQPITLAWKPGYEWELSITDVADAGTKGGITMLIRSRYPADRSPVDSSAKNNAKQH